MADDRFLSRLKRGVVLINTSRGGVIDEAALVRAVDQGRVLGAALDVFADEPQIPADLLERIQYATPHVAGRSLEGMSLNTRHAVRALATHFGETLDFDPRPLYPAPPVWRAKATDDLAAALADHWDLDVLDRLLREGIHQPDPLRKKLFKSVREREPLRRDLTSFSGRSTAPPALRRFLDALPENDA